MKSPRSPAGQAAQRPRAFAVKSGKLPLESVQEHNEVAEQAAFGELLSYSLERLSKEPELLKAEREQLRRNGQDAAIKHYRAFITGSGCLQSVETELKQVEASLQGMQAHLPQLGQAGQTFSSGAKAAIDKLSETRQIHDSQAALMELLEIPQLMETCMRNGNHDDALALRSLLAKLAFLHSDVQVVERLVEQGEAVAQAMLQQLLSRLRANVQLPECLRIVGHLRRLSVFSEQELRLRFLQCREAWLVEMLAEVEEGPAHDFLKRITDIHRLHLFDIIMQFRALFAEEALGQDEKSSGGDGGLLFSWAEHRLTLYLGLLRDHLPRITEGGPLASVVEHTMYCGMSLARVGLDFRSILPPIFEACILSLFSQAMATAIDMFALVLDKHKWVALSSASSASRARRGLPPKDSAAEAGIGEKAEGSGNGGLLRAPSQSGENEGPPYRLMEHFPLAVLANRMAAAFNELRHCAPIGLQSQTAQIVQEALESCAGQMVQYGSTKSLAESEQHVFAAACREFAATLAPHVCRCFLQIYPEASAEVDSAAASADVKRLGVQLSKEAGSGEGAPEGSDNTSSSKYVSRWADQPIPHPPGQKVTK
ncbi:hypothetical protein WJX74_000423 [Apatococcus lobatus]|uniref:Conserved oligomeric Golgi complex subunit 8 n=1 Tax=Apatococcus lobatus TaxID=904363 RepID=A0AAW1SDE3_9CHLO